MTLTSVPVKEFHACVGKLGKAIDTVFDQPSHDELTWDHEMDERLVAEAIALHLYREGMCDLADEYVASKGLDDVVEMEVDETDVVDGRAEGADGAEPSGSECPSSEPPSDPVSEAAVEAAAERRKLRPLWDELRRITRAVSVDHDLDVVSDWIRTNRDALVASVGPAEGESLAREVEFMTAKIRYVKLIVAGDGAGAIAQGRRTSLCSPRRWSGSGRSSASRGTRRSRWWTRSSPRFERRASDWSEPPTPASVRPP